MSGIVASIRHNLAGLARFSGREARRAFWPYAIALFLLSALATMVLMVSVFADMMVRMQLYLIAHPEGLPPPTPGRPGALPPELTPDLSGLAMPMLVTNVILVLLLAAAVARRLHDCDRTGLWGLLPLPFMMIGMANTRAALALASGQREPGGMESLLLMTGPLFWLSLIVLIVFLAGEGTKGANRFGPEPAWPARREGA